MRASLLALLALALVSCSSEECSTDADCEAGEACAAGSCDGVIAATCAGDRARCSSGEDCASLQCVAGCCAGTCSADTDCLSDEQCRSGFCRGREDQTCFVDGDCAPSTPRCRRNDGRCVACLASSDCADGEECRDTACVVQAGRCLADEHCTQESPHCSPETRRCVACLSSTDCDEGDECLAGACVAIAGWCADEANCAALPATPHCNVDARTCVACMLDHQCPADAGHCDPVAHLCVKSGCDEDDCPGARCLSDGSCGSLNDCADTSDCTEERPYCHSTDRRCVECLASRDCGLGRVCANGTCLDETSCDSDDECAAPTSRCRSSDGTCVACLDVTDCGSLHTCTDGACVARPCAEDGECAALNPSTPHCVSGRCISCRTDEQCGARRACLAGSCTDVACRESADCAPGALCAAYTCIARPGLDEPCNATGACPAGLICSRLSGTPTCRLPCDPAAPRCAAQRRCGLDGWNAAGPTGVCVPPTGAGAVGAVCTSDAGCEVGLLCVPESASSSRCRALCAPSGASCIGTESCLPLVRNDGAGIPRTVHACFIDTRWGDLCANDAACDPGQICAPGPDPRAPATVRNLCRWPLGTKAAGAGCVDDAECRSARCVPGNPLDHNEGFSGSCARACVDDAECPSANRLSGACALVEQPAVDPSGASVVATVPECIAQCWSDADCAPGHTCRLQPNARGSDWIARCVPRTSQSNRWGGATCVADDECASGTCLKFGANTTDGLCLGLCDPRALTGDCDWPGACAPYGVLRTLPGADGVIGTSDDVARAARLCWGHTCTRDSDCTDGGADPTKPRVCALDPDPRAPLTNVLLSCTPRLGPLGGGAVCTRDGDCASGWCASWPSGARRCFAPCVTAADCTGGTSADTRCAPVRLRPDSTQLVDACVPL